MNPIPPKPVSRPEREHEPDEGRREQNLDDCEEPEHAIRLKVAPRARAGDLEAAVRPDVLHLQGGAVDSEPLVEEGFQLEADPVTPAPGWTSTCAESAGKPSVQTWRSWVSTTRDGSRWRARHRPSGGCGAPSRKMRLDSRRSDHAAANISAATSSDAIGSRRFQPVRRIRTAATPVPMNAARSVTIWRYAPRTLRLWLAHGRAAPPRPGSPTIPTAATAGHHRGVDLGRLEKPANRLVHDPDPEEKQREVDQREDSTWPNLERPAPTGRPRGQRRRDERKAERGGVGQHMAGVC